METQTKNIKTNLIEFNLFIPNVNQTIKLFQRDLHSIQFSYENKSLLQIKQKSRQIVEEIYLKDKE